MKPKLNSAPRPRDLVLDALVAVDGSDPRQCTSLSFSIAAKARKVIEEVTHPLTAEEVGRRAQNYRLHFPHLYCSPMALAKYWGKCHTGPEPKRCF